MRSISSDNLSNGTDGINEENVAALTILTCLGSARATKIFHSDGDGGYAAVGYDKAVRFRHRLALVPDFKNLMGLLEGIASGADESFIVRGVVKPEYVGQSAVFRRYNNPDLSTNHLADVSQYWAAFDLDSWPINCSDGLEAAFIRARTIIAAAAGTELAPGLGGAACVWQVSSSQGLAPGLRGRLWFLLAEPLTCAELKRWFIALNDSLSRGGEGFASNTYALDRSLAVASQPHYVRNPIFKPPLVDPVARRWGILAGDGRATLRLPSMARSYAAPRSATAFSLGIGLWIVTLRASLGQNGEWRGPIKSAVYQAIADGASADCIKQAIRRAAEQARAAGRGSAHGHAYEEEKLQDDHLDSLIADAQFRERASRERMFSEIRRALPQLNGVSLSADDIELMQRLSEHNVET